MSKRKILQSVIPKGFLWRLTSLNVIVIAGTILLSGLAIYQTACFLVDGIGEFSITKQQRFNATLFQYVFLFAIIAVFISSIVHFYFTKKLIDPVKKLIESTKVLKQGSYPEPLPVSTKDEVGQLVSHYNDLIQQLQENEQNRNNLIADISHEFRTPIANLTGYLHALKSGDIEADLKLYQSLHGQAVQLANLMEQMDHLNDWNRFRSDNRHVKENIPIKKLIEESVHMFTWKIKEEGLDLKVTADEADVCIHKEGIRQVLNNLIDNAIRYYEGIGPISVIGKKGEKYYQISVTNPGPQIDGKEQQQLFERFYRIEKSRNRKTGGSGLGLAIAQEIMENHSGKIDVYSDQHKNTFTIKLLIMNNHV